MKFDGSKAKNRPFNKSNIHFELDPGEVRTVYLRAKSTPNGGLPLPVTMEKGGDDPDVALKWFKGRGSGGTEITGQVEAGTYTFDLPAGKTRYFRWRVEQLTTAASCGFTSITYPTPELAGRRQSPRQLLLTRPRSQPRE